MEAAHFVLRGLQIEVEMQVVEAEIHDHEMVRGMEDVRYENHCLDHEMDLKIFEIVAFVVDEMGDHPHLLPKWRKRGLRRSQ